MSTCHTRLSFPVLSKVICINYSSKHTRCSAAKKWEPNCCVLLRKNAFVKIKSCPFKSNYNQLSLPSSQDLLAVNLDLTQLLKHTGNGCHF